MSINACASESRIGPRLYSREVKSDGELSFFVGSGIGPRTCASSPLSQRLLSGGIDEFVIERFQANSNTLILHSNLLKSRYP